MLLLRRRSRRGSRLGLGILVVGLLRVRVVLPVGLVGVLVREDVLHGHVATRMQSPSLRVNERRASLYDEQVSLVINVGRRERRRRLVGGSVE